MKFYPKKRKFPPSLAHIAFSAAMIAGITLIGADSPISVSQAETLKKEETAIPGMRRFIPEKRPISEYVRGNTGFKPLAAVQPKKQDPSRGYTNIVLPNTQSVAGFADVARAQKTQGIKSLGTVSKSCQEKLSRMDPETQRKIGVIIGSHCPLIVEQSQ